MGEASRLVVVSNRGPISYVRDSDGQLVAKRGAGGLVVTLGPGVARDGALWMSTTTSPDDVEGSAGAPATVGDIRFQPIAVDPTDYAAYYDVVANQTLWFCLHGLWDQPRRPRFDRHWWAAWERFKAVSEQLAAAVDEASADGATVLIQDYQLALLPGLLAKRRPDIKSATFLHTPWCSPSEIAVLPDEVGADVLAGLSGGGPCGFHSARWASAFEDCCAAVLGVTPTTFVGPAATDVDDLRGVASSPECLRETEVLQSQVGGRRLIVRVDRIELSKNVLRGFWAYDELLTDRPDLRGEVSFAAMVYPSRIGLPEYLAYGQEVQSVADQINAKWARDDWTPIVLNTDDNHPRSVAALASYDVLLVNPVRDGLNLVAKEGPLVNQRDGVVVLSRQAGAWDQIGDHTIGINPFDVTATAAALGRALDLSPAERSERAAGLRSAVLSRSPLDWFDDQLTAADLPG